MTKLPKDFGRLKMEDKCDCAFCERYEKEERLRQDAKRRTKERHDLHDSPWVWLAAPILLLAVLAIGWVRSVVGV